MVRRGRTAMADLGLGPDTLAGQVAVVTGAGRGIGRETARALAWAGARVVIAELDPVGGSETEALIREAGGEARFIRTDVSDEASVLALAESVHVTFGPADILVNNAIVCPVVAVAEMAAATWDQVMAVNLRGSFLTCRAFLPDMLERAQGTIVNMVSTDAMPGLAAYIASKQGIVGFSQSLALEVGDRGVRVVAFGPGMVDTPGIRSVAPDLAPRLGLSEDQFLNVPLHTAYEGLMPAAHAGIATVYLIAKLADAYHGEVVDGYTVLEQAGLIEAPTVPADVPASEIVPTVVSTLDTEAAGREIRSLCRALAAILAETGEEFSRLPVFARPLARRGFKSKAGRGLQEWSQAVEDLVERMAADAVSGAEAARFAASLEKLITYYEGVPAETARFTRDAELLRQVAQVTQARVATIEKLAGALRAWRTA